MSNPKNKTTEDNKTLLKFPCMFPVKIMGLNKPELESIVKKIFDENLSTKNKDSIEINTHVSKHQNYLSITVKFMAESKKQLDKIYNELSKHCGQDDHDLIKMIL